MRSEATNSNNRHIPHIPTINNTIALTTWHHSSFELQSLFILVHKRKTFTIDPSLKMMIQLTCCLMFHCNTNQGSSLLEKMFLDDNNFIVQDVIVVVAVCQYISD